jgi:hypothetical protein
MERLVGERSTELARCGATGLQCRREHGRNEGKIQKGRRRSTTNIK